MRRLAMVTFLTVIPFFTACFEGASSDDDQEEDDGAGEGVSEAALGSGVVSGPNGGKCRSATWNIRAAARSP